MQFRNYLSLSIIFFIFTQVLTTLAENSGDENEHKPKQGRWFGGWLGARSPKNNQVSNTDEDEPSLNTNLVSSALNYAQNMGSELLAPLEPAVSKYGDIIAKNVEPLTKMAEKPQELSKIRQHLNHLIKATNPIPLIQQFLGFIRDLFTSPTLKLAMQFLQLEKKVLGSFKAFVSPLKYAGEVAGQGLKRGTELAESAFNAPLNLAESVTSSIPVVNNVVSGTTGIARNGVQGAKDTVRGVSDNIFSLGGRAFSL